MINKKYLYYFILTLLLSCKNDTVNKNGTSIKKTDLLEKQIDIIKNKKILSLAKVLGDSTILKNHVLFLYNGYDCGSCIDIGYEMSKKMDSLIGNQLVYIISTSANIGQDQLKNNYQKFVYNDENDLIRKDLKFIKTPVFLYLDSKNKIKNAFYPNYNRDVNKENLFIKACIEDQIVPF